jgi:hypothetical protein
VEELRDHYLDEPLERRLGRSHPLRDEVLRRHAAAVVDGIPTYRDPSSGLAVFTARFLAERGWCCDSGCRHCPFVPRH